MQHNKSGLRFSILFGIMLTIGLIYDSQFSEWTFCNNFLVITGRIIGNTILAGFILSVIYTFKPISGLIKFLGSVFVFILITISFFEIFPIDTYTTPVDLSVIESYTDGTKLIFRQYENAKTSKLISDTVLVKDVWVFRKILTQFKED